MRCTGWAFAGFGAALVLTLLGGCVPLAVQRQASVSPVPTKVGVLDSPEVVNLPTITPTDWPSTTPSAAPTSTSTLTPTSTQTPIPPSPTSTATSTPTPTATGTPSPLPPTPTITPSALLPTVTTAPSATATPQTHRYQPAGPALPDASHPCPGCPRAPAYIVGRISDPAGNPLAGVRLVCYNEWYRYPVVVSKISGEYDFPITQANTTWYVVVVNEGEQPLSPEVPVPFDLDQSCRYILDWQRLD